MEYQDEEGFIPNPYEELQKSQETLIKQEPKLNELNRLCYEVFLMGGTGGKELYEMMKERFLLTMSFDPRQPNSRELAVYNEGCRGVVIGLMELAKTHQRQIMEMKSDEPK